MVRLSTQPLPPQHPGPPAWVDDSSSEASSSSESWLSDSSSSNSSFSGSSSSLPGSGFNRSSSSSSSVTSEMSLNWHYWMSSGSSIDSWMSAREELSDSETSYSTISPVPLGENVQEQQDQAQENQEMEVNQETADLDQEEGQNQETAGLDQEEGQNQENKLDQEDGQDQENELDQENEQDQENELDQEKEQDQENKLDQEKEQLPSPMEKNEEESQTYISESEQKELWDKLKTDIKQVLNEMDPRDPNIALEKLWKLNLYRGRGLFCQAIMEVQAANIHDSDAYASLVARLNLLVPVVVELLITRCLEMASNAFKSRDIDRCKPLFVFIGHLANHNLIYRLNLKDLIYTLEKDGTTCESMQLVTLMLELCGDKYYEDDTYELSLPSLMRSYRQLLGREHNSRKFDDILHKILKLEDNKFDSAKRPKLNAQDALNRLRQLPHVIEPYHKCFMELNHFKFEPEYHYIEQAYKKAITVDYMVQVPCDVIVKKCDVNIKEDYECTDKEALQIKAAVELYLLKKLLLESVISLELKSPAEHSMREKRKEHFKYCCNEHRNYTQDGGGEAQTITEYLDGLSDTIEDIYVSVYEEQYSEHVNFWVEVCGLRQLAILLSTNTISWSIFSKLFGQQTMSVYNEPFIKTLFDHLVRMKGMRKLVSCIRNPYVRPSLRNRVNKDELSKNIIRLLEVYRMHHITREMERGVYWAHVGMRF